MNVPGIGSKRWAIIVLAILLILLGALAVTNFQFEQSRFVLGVLEIGDGLLWLFET